MVPLLSMRCHLVVAHCTTLMKQTAPKPLWYWGEQHIVSPYGESSKSVALNRLWHHPSGSPRCVFKHPRDYLSAKASLSQNALPTERMGVHSAGWLFPHLKSVLFCCTKCFENAISDLSARVMSSLVAFSSEGMWHLLTSNGFICCSFCKWWLTKVIDSWVLICQPKLESFPPQATVNCK